MSVFKVIVEGLRRAAGAPWLVLGLVGVTMLSALPAALVITNSLDESFGTSLVADRMREGFDADWLGEYAYVARGLERTFGHQVHGALAFYHNLEGWVSGSMFRRYPMLVMLGAIHGLVWAWLLGGVVHRLVHPDTRGAGPLIRNGSRYFTRFVRLSLCSAILYWLVYRLHRGVFEWLEGATRDVTSERTVLLLSLGAYALTAFLLTLVHNAFGYAKIATVLEDRRSMLLAALRGTGFLLFHPGKALALYYAFAAGSLLILAAYGRVAPGPGSSSVAAVLAACFLAQLVIGLRMGLRLGLLGAQLGLYRSVLGDGPHGSEEV